MLILPLKGITSQVVLPRSCTNKIFIYYYEKRRISNDLRNKYMFRILGDYQFYPIKLCFLRENKKLMVVNIPKIIRTDPPAKSYWCRRYMCFPFSEVSLNLDLLMTRKLFECQDGVKK